MLADDYLGVLNSEQRAAVEHTGSPLLILAGAGSGKTRVITTKIAWLIRECHIDPAGILAVTFTKKAASEMQERAVNIEERARFAQIRTFHSFGAYFLRKHAGLAGVDKNFTVYDDDDMITLLCKAVPSLTKKDASRLAHKISLAKDYCLSPDSPELEQIEADPDFADIYASYQKRLRDTGNVYFGDLIMLPYEILRDNEFIRRETHSRYKVIMVDEYQDSNVAQFKFLQLLSGVDEGSGTYVCVVGDDDQSIYKFRGAEVQNILNFQEHFPGTKLIRLETNYRSHAEILACADSVVKNNSGRLGKTLVAARGKGKKPVMVFLPTQDDETQFCAELIMQAADAGVPYSNWAVLYRTNAQSLGFESEFLHQKIPYQIVGSLKFYEREEIKDALAWLSFTANPRDEISFRRIVNKPARGIGATTQDRIVAAGTGSSLVFAAQKMKLSKKAAEGIEKFCSLFNSLNEMIPDEESAEANTGTSESEANLSEFVKEAVIKSGLLDYHREQDEITGTQKEENLHELMNSAVPYKCTRQGLLEFLDHINLDRTLDLQNENSDEDRVTLITLHNTKGLEFPRVIITGMEGGIFPREDKTEAELEEERRLLYVGITRAKDELYFTSCRSRRLYGQIKYMSPSPFLAEIAPSLVRVLGEKPASLGFGADDVPPEAKKYKKGTLVYHDDYGHGEIIAASKDSEGEYVVTVSFETGGIKKILPKYQSSSLLVEDTDF